MLQLSYRIGHGVDLGRTRTAEKLITPTQVEEHSIWVGVYFILRRRCYGNQFCINRFIRNFIGTII